MCIVVCLDVKPVPDHWMFFDLAKWVRACAHIPNSNTVHCSSTLTAYWGSAGQIRYGCAQNACVWYMWTHFTKWRRPTNYKWQNGKVRIPHCLHLKVALPQWRIWLELDSRCGKISYLWIKFLNNDYIGLAFLVTISNSVLSQSLSILRDISHKM